MQLLPEWARQEAVILAWPDEQTDWQPWMSDVRATYMAIIEALNARGVGVVLLVRAGNEEATCEALNTMQKVLLVSAEYNDTWVRDYAFLTCETEAGKRPVEFVFNGWGQKFDARNDNLINQTCLASLCRQPLYHVDLVAEGGALEIDQHGHLLSTSSCLFNPKRNGNINQERYAQVFASALGYTEFTVLQHGHLEGDDTDGHIDTLVRFTPDSGLVMQTSYNRPSDTHFDSLSAMRDECRRAFADHDIFELPLPHIVNQEQQRLPASYANFLITNGAVLMPVYRQPEDSIAIQVMQRAYPDHEIVPIDCSPLIEQFGSLHCISMQVPVHTLLPEVVRQMNSGVSIYADQ